MSNTGNVCRLTRDQNSCHRGGAASKEAALAASGAEGRTTTLMVDVPIQQTFKRCNQGVDLAIGRIRQFPVG